MKNIRSSGFTLLEVAIVLLIITVLTGGIILGRSLVVNARLQTVVTDLDSYTAAVNNFNQAYQGLPGDFPDAVTRWGTDSNGCPSGGGATGTCNGDGNGMIVNVNAASQANESFLFWQHLAKAGMVSLAFSNRAGSASANEAKINTNVPSSAIEGSGFSVFWLGTLASDADRFDGAYGNVFQLGAAASGTVTRAPILTPEQAADIDTKIDDAIPATGKVRAYKSTSSINPSCTTTAVASTAAYNLTNTSRLCSLLFVQGF